MLSQIYMAIQRNTYGNLAPFDSGKILNPCIVHYKLLFARLNDPPTLSSYEVPAGIFQEHIGVADKSICDATPCHTNGTNICVIRPICGIRDRNPFIPETSR